jgi:hypothetical protein
MGLSEDDLGFILLGAFQPALDFTYSAGLGGYIGLSEGFDVLRDMGDRIHWDVKTLPDVQELFPQPATRKKGNSVRFLSHSFRSSGLPH